MDHEAQLDSKYVVEGLCKIQIIMVDERSELDDAYHSWEKNCAVWGAADRGFTGVQHRGSNISVDQLQCIT